MNRRDFLKCSGLLSTALFVQLNPLSKMVSMPSEAQAGGKVYRGTSDGKIHVSANAGRTWDLHTNFGSEFSILDMTTDVRENIHAQLEFSGYSFQLMLSPGSNVWRTV